MAQGIKTSDDQRTRIVALLRQGKSRNEVARLTGSATGTVTAVARQEGITLDRTRAEKLQQAAQDWTLIRRLELYNQGFEKLAEMLPDIKSAKEMQHWTISVCALADKRRLETGEVTARTENRPSTVLILPDDGRLSPEKRAELLGQTSVEQVIVPERMPTHDELDALVPLTPGEVRMVVPSNGRGDLPVGAVQVMRSWPNGTAGGASE